MKKRTICSACQRPISTCYCDLVIKSRTRIELIIWQHPSEQGHAKATAPILNASLEPCRIELAETASPAQLGLLEEDCWLVYPSQEGLSSSQVSKTQSGKLYGDDSQSPGEKVRLASTNKKVANSRVKAITQPKQLLLLDGTWRKSRKLMYLNPWLNKLKRLSLEEFPSRYVIRKAEKPGQLSTFEAGVRALAKCNAIENEAALLASFEHIMSQSLAFRNKRKA